MKKLWLAVLALAVAGGLIWWSSPKTGPSTSADASEGAKPGQPVSAHPDGRRLLDKGARTATPKAPPNSEAPDKLPVAPETPLPTLAEDPYVALTGLEVDIMTDSLTEQFEIPDHPQTGKGVLVTKVDPSSPAAETALRPQDVIVIADHKAINSAEDLREAVKGRTHTLLIISRDGTFHQVVLKPPYRPK